LAIFRIDLHFGGAVFLIVVTITHHIAPGLQPEIADLASIPNQFSFEAFEVGAQEIDAAVDSDRSREPRGGVGHPAAQRASTAP